MNFKTLIAAAAFVASAFAGSSSAAADPPAYTSAAPPAYTSAAPPPYPYGSFSGSVCVETSTMIWRSSTSVTVYTVTAASGWATPSAGVAAPTGGVPAAPAASTSQWPVPATNGGASSVSNLKAAGVAGAAIFVGAAAVLL